MLTYAATYMEQREFNHFAQLLDLLLATTDVSVGDIRLVFNLHNTSQAVGVVFVRGCSIAVIDGTDKYRRFVPPIPASW
jgi:hypothetical protein